MNTMFCIPYAGGAASAYGELKAAAKKKNLDLVLLELAGHSSRISAPLYQNFSEAADDCCRMIADYLNTHYIESYSIFGHSMGSWIAYELIGRLQKNPMLTLPNKLFLSSNRVPQIREKVDTTVFSDDQFWNWIYHQGGLEKELYEMPEFKDYYLPVVRNDYRILGEYAGPEVPERMLPMDLYMMCGTEDEVTPEELGQWKRFTNHNFETTFFEGDHFYFRGQAKKIVDYFCERI